MKTLQINVAEQVATYDKAQGHIVCGNSGYQIKFTFDEAWGTYPTKKARFVFGKEYKDVEFTGDTCPVPAIVNQQKVEVGVFVEGEDMCTTTAAEIACLPSILCVGSQRTDGRVYYNGDSCFIRYSAKADGTDYTEEWSAEQCYIGIATGQEAPTDKSGYIWSKFIHEPCGFPYRTVKPSEIDDLRSDDAIGVYHVHEVTEHDEGEGNPPTYTTECYSLIVLRGDDYNPFTESSGVSDTYKQMKIKGDCIYLRSHSSYDGCWTDWKALATQEYVDQKIAEALGL
jgi:hypothetical protein